jgi:hypothetical protein
MTAPPCLLSLNQQKRCRTVAAARLDFKDWIRSALEWLVVERTIQGHYQHVIDLLAEDDKDKHT